MFIYKSGLWEGDKRGMIPGLIIPSVSILIVFIQWRGAYLGRYFSYQGPNGP